MIKYRSRTAVYRYHSRAEEARKRVVEQFTVALLEDSLEYTLPWF